MITIDHTVFWVVIWPIIGFMMYTMRPSGRVWRYRGSWGEPGQGSHGTFDSGGSRHHFDPEPLLKEIDAQREQIEEMSARLAELENRADFTERMLAGPKQGVSHQ